MSQIYYIALSTFRESIRSKVLYSLIFFAIVLVSMSAFFGSVTIGDQVKVIKDFGLFSISLFSVAYAVISGSALLFKELSRKTVYNILAKSVPRWKFLFGKYLGMLLTAIMLLFWMGVGFSVFVAFFEGSLDSGLVVAYLHMGLELVIVCAAAILFSSIVVTPILIGMFTFGVFLAGRSSELLLYFIERDTVSGLGALVLKGLYWLLPHLNRMSVSDRVVYNESIPLEQFLLSACYAVGYAGILLVIANLLFQRREFN